jgi:hypothetical protein
MHQYNVVPFERMAIEVAGPVPQSDQGNRYLLIAVDYFRKWPEAYAIPSQEASTVAEALVTNFLCASAYIRSCIVTRAITSSLICYRRFCNAWE